MYIEWPNELVHTLSSTISLSNANKLNLDHPVCYVTLERGPTYPAAIFWPYGRSDGRTTATANTQMGQGEERSGQDRELISFSGSHLNHPLPLTNRFFLSPSWPNRCWRLSLYRVTGGRVPWLDWLRFGMFHHPACAVGSLTAHQPWELSKSKST